MTLDNVAAFGAAIHAKAKSLPKPGPRVFTAGELLATEFPEPVWAVEGLIPEGLTLLAGRPKLGKSWKALGISVSVAAGALALGRFPTKQGAALFLGLEDTPRRLRGRLEMMCPDGSVPSALRLATDLPRIDDGGLDVLEAMVDGIVGLRLVVLDTLARIRPRRKKNEDLYQADSDLGAALQGFALRRHLALLLVHHLRKAESEDPFERISGTTGLSGSADALHVLERKRGTADAVLHVTGRDFEEAEHALSFDSSTGVWTSTGDATALRLSTERREVLDAVLAAPGPITPKEVADRLGRSPNAVNRLMWSMQKDGLLASGRRWGSYVPASYPSTTTDKDGKK